MKVGVVTPLGVSHEIDLALAVETYIRRGPEEQAALLSALIERMHACGTLSDEDVTAALGYEWEVVE